jgi:hypothetical protein
MSSTCQIRSLPGGRDGSTVEYSWKITAKTPQANEDRVLSVVHLTREPKWGPRGSRQFLYCKAGSTHEIEITLKVNQSHEGGEREFWFEGFLDEGHGKKTPLPESAVASATTRQIGRADDHGQLIGIKVSDDGQELRRNFIFISFISPADLQKALPPDLGEDEREPRDGNEWFIFTDPKGWKPAFRRFTELDK